jgi:hypothetical protein
MALISHQQECLRILDSGPPTPGIDKVTEAQRGTVTDGVANKGP